MTLETSPQPGRLPVSAAKAAKMLRLDVRTVRRKIERGELAGFAEQGPKQQRWYVYADQLSTPATAAAAGDRDRSPTDSAELQRLRTANADLTSKLRAAEEVNRLLLAAQATQREAFAAYRHSVDDILKGAASYRQTAEHFERATTGLQATEALLTTAIDTYGEALVQYGYDHDPRMLIDSSAEQPDH